MRLTVLFVLFVLHAPFASACWIVHQIKDEDAAVWPLPAIIEVEPIRLAAVQAAKPALVRVRITLIEEKLKLPSFGRVQHILLKRYRSNADVGRENPESQFVIDRSTGAFETTFLSSELQGFKLRLVFVCEDIQAFYPCGGGDLIYEIQQTEANQALQHNDHSCHELCLRTPRASCGRG